MGVSFEDSFFKDIPLEIEEGRFIASKSSNQDFCVSRIECGKRHWSSLSADLQSKLYEHKNSILTCQAFVTEALPHSKRIRAMHGVTAGLLKVVDIKGIPFTLVASKKRRNFSCLGKLVDRVDLYKYISGRMSDSGDRNETK